MKKPREAPSKICTKCDIKKLLYNFPAKQNGKYESRCKLCKVEYNKQYARKNKEKLNKYHSEWVENNSNKRKQHLKKYYEKNKESILESYKNRYYDNIDYEHLRSKKYREKNISKIRKNRAIRAKLRRYTDVSFRLKQNVSRAIRYALGKLGFNKEGQSFIKYVNYSMNDLKQHLESQFEDWMNWNNYGVYRSCDWSDDDCATWTWQIDHIIPQADLLYTSMKEKNFKKCWHLNNLRPLSSKQNLLDGITRVRHM